MEGKVVAKSHPAQTSVQRSLTGRDAATGSDRAVDSETAHRRAEPAAAVVCGAGHRTRSELGAVDDREVAAHLRSQVLQVIQVVVIQSVRGVVEPHGNRIGRAR